MIPKDPELKLGVIGTASEQNGQQPVMAAPDGPDSLTGHEPSAADSPPNNVQTVPTTAAQVPVTVKKPKPLWQRIVSPVVTVGIILLIFLGVFPQFANYADAWTAMKSMSAGWLVALIVATVVNQISLVWPYQAVLPHLRYRYGFFHCETTSAISNTVPAGGAVAIGMTFRMFGSFGFSNLAVSTAVATTGVWNLGFKLAFPIVVVLVVAVTGQSLAGAAGLAVAGLVVFGVFVLAVWMVSRSESGARRFGHFVDKIVNWALHFFHKPKSDRVERAVLAFRIQSNDVLHQRGRLLTGAVLASQLAILALVFVCVRSVGITPSQVSTIEVLLAIAVARLASVIPLTPGGLGITDAAFIGMLTALGANSSAALAADLLWRLTTYFPPIFIGIVTYLLWKRGVVRGKYAQGPDAIQGATPEHDVPAKVPGPPVVNL